MFGPYPASTVNRVCKTIERIMTLLPFGWSKRSDPIETAQNAKKRKEFGHNINFTYSDGFLDPQTSKAMSHLEPTSLSGYDSLSDSEEVPVKSKIANFVASTLQSTSTAASSKGTSAEASAGVNHSPPTSERCLYSSDWLIEQCRVCASEGEFTGELTWNDLYHAVFEQLSSSRDNTVIQNDVRQSSLEKMIMVFIVG